MFFCKQKRTRLDDFKGNFRVETIAPHRLGKKYRDDSEVRHADRQTDRRVSTDD